MEVEDEDADVSRDFCCFLCNGQQIVQGYLTLSVSFVSLYMYNGVLLEHFEYGTVCSVNEEEPPTTHSCIINLPHHSIYLCHLLRKELLLKVFNRLGLYKPDIHLPAETLGFPTGGLGGLSCSPNAARLVYKLPTAYITSSHHHCHHHHHHHQDDTEERNSKTVSYSVQCVPVEHINNSHDLYPT